MATIQGCVPGRAEFPPSILPMAMANLFLCLFPQTGSLLGVDGLGFLTVGIELKGIILRGDAEGKGKTNFFHFKAFLDEKNIKKCYTKKKTKNKKNPHF